MATTSTFTAVAIVEPAFTQPDRPASAEFLAGYTGLTREAYALDLAQYGSWCQQRHLRLFQGRRADIECFARDLRGRPRLARLRSSLRGCLPGWLMRRAVSTGRWEVRFHERTRPSRVGADILASLFKTVQ